MTPVAERPIIFGVEGVRAILAGTKTQTRRVIKPQPNAGTNGRMVTLGGASWGLLDGYLLGEWRCPYGVPGDRLWVRETWLELDGRHQPPRCAYRADQKPGDLDSEEIRQEYIRCGYPYRWRPSIHMPRWASRLTLELTDVRVQRLQEISEQDAQAEGAVYYPEIPRGRYGDNGTRWQMAVVPRDTDDCLTSARLAFGNAWNKINGSKRAMWSSNPWVWAISFRRVAR